MSKKQKHFKSSTSSITPQSLPENSESVRYKLAIVLSQAFGFIILALSWYFENKMVADRLEERYDQDLLRTQTMHMETSLDVLEQSATLFSWYSRNQEHAAGYADTLRLQFAYKYGIMLAAYNGALVGMLEKKKEIIPPSFFKRLSASFDMARDTLKKLYRMDNLDGMESYVAAYAFLLRGAGTKPYLDAFYESVNKTKKGIDNANAKYLILYLLGSICLLYAFYLQVQEDYEKGSWKFIRRLTYVPVLIFVITLSILIFW